MFRRSGRTFAGVLAPVAGLAVALGAAILAPPIAGTGADPDRGTWPAMTLVYEVTSKQRGLDNPAETRRWRLTYQDQRHWRKELLDSAADPREVGTIYRFEGTTYTVYSALVRQTVHTEEYPAEPLAPERWFFPGRERALEGKGYAKQIAPDGRHTKYVKTETVRCEVDDVVRGRQATGVTQPPSCATSPTYQATETVVYRADLVVPVEITTMVGGETAERMVLTESTTP